MLWNPKKKEIKDWLDSKTLEFAHRERGRLRLSLEDCLDRYLYTDIHAIFCAMFPIVLHEWLSRLETRQTKFQRMEAIEWIIQLIHELASVSNPISRAIDFWVNSILQGYITKFVVETIT